MAVFKPNIKPKIRSAVRVPVHSCAPVLHLHKKTPPWKRTRRRRRWFNLPDAVVGDSEAALMMDVARGQCSVLWDTRRSVWIGPPRCTGGESWRDLFPLALFLSLSRGSVLPTVFPVSRCEGTVRRSTVGGGGRKDRELLHGSAELVTGLMSKCISPSFNHNLLTGTSRSVQDLICRGHDSNVPPTHPGHLYISLKYFRIFDFISTAVAQIYFLWIFNMLVEKLIHSLKHK